MTNLNLKQSPRDNGRVYLSINSLNPIAHFQEVARKMTAEDMAKKS
ncbi:MAG: hypothetical protein KGZ50_00565 [Peptococcaceae bacterium]|nr:hypothetical protein [Peptococcaceae bacterium]